MAWIKVDHLLPDKPEVLAIASKLGIDQDAVVGKCLRVWIWFDKYTPDGNAPGVTKNFIDRTVDLFGFAEAMVAAGWLRFNKDGSATIPSFELHNGETARTRALTARRQERHKARRNGKSNAGPVTESVTPSVTKGVTKSQSQSKEVDGADNKSAEGESAANDRQRDPAIYEGRADDHAMCLFAESLFSKINYAGSDGELLWRVAVLIREAVVSPNEAYYAAQGAKDNATSNPIGYMLKVLRDKCGKRLNIDDELKRVRFPAGFDFGPPRQLSPNGPPQPRGGKVKQFGDQCGPLLDAISRGQQENGNSEDT